MRSAGGTGGEYGGTGKPEIYEPWKVGAEAWRVRVRSAPDWLGDLGKETQLFCACFVTCPAEITNVPTSQEP